jgi:hypothetical protein
VAAQSRRRVDVEGLNLLRRVLGDLFNVHAAFGRRDNATFEVSRSTSAER